jgi:hypothetical protein
MQLNAVTSGFYSHQNLNWLGGANAQPGFCVLKLHGSICYFADEAAGYDTLFKDHPLQRAEKLFKKSTDGILPPILFPWEILTKTGLGDTQSFPLSRELHPLFSGIWQKARREVQSADKISFVGMSMHSFLEDGLKYLFDGKEGQVEVCVTNPDNTAWVRGNHESYWQNKPHSSAYAVDKVLKKYAPKMSRVGMHQGGLQTDMITLVNDFGSFVKTQMTPMVTN